jgi:uncharacterized membrane protein
MSHLKFNIIVNAAVLAIVIPFIIMAFQSGILTGFIVLGCFVFAGCVAYMWTHEEEFNDYL